jgi:hypothetical protein
VLRVRTCPQIHALSSTTPCRRPHTADGPHKVLGPQQRLMTRGSHERPRSEGVRRGRLISRNVRGTHLGASFLRTTARINKAACRAHRAVPPLSRYLARHRTRQTRTSPIVWLGIGPRSCFSPLKALLRGPGPSQEHYLPPMLRAANVLR